MFNKPDISSEFIYRHLDSDRSTSELLELIAGELAEKVDGSLWNIGILNESSAKIEFVKKNDIFSEINKAALRSIEEKALTRDLKVKISGYKYAVVSPLKYNNQLVGILISLSSKKVERVIEKACWAIAFFIAQHRLKNKLLEDAMVMNVMINASQNTSSDKSIRPLVIILTSHLKEHLKASGVRLYMKYGKDGIYSYDTRGNQKKFSGALPASITREVLESKRPRMIQNVAREDKFNEAIDDISGPEGIKELIAVPLIVGASSVGVLAAAGSPGREVFAGSDLVWTKSIAAEIAAVYERLKLYRDIHKLFISSVEAFAAAIDGKDPYTHGHSRRVTMYCMLLGKALKLEQEKLENLRLTALMHDIGKIAVPGSILTKEAKLTDEEWGQLKEHPSRGASILNHVKEFGPLLPGIKHHHERWDGDGYPDGLSKENIPYIARIITVADAFDAMISKRVYRKALSEEEALKELADCSGTQFDKELASVFIKEYKKKFYAGEKETI